MMADEKPVNVICFKWGKTYSAEYVNRLFRGVTAYLHRPFRFVCFTDDRTGLAEGIEPQRLPMPPAGWTHAWPHIFLKLCLFQDGLAGLEGPTLFMDIDQIVMGDLDRFFDYAPGRFCIIRNWIELRKRLFRRLPAVGNSSCFRFEAGRSQRVYDQFVAELDHVTDQRLYRTEQAFMTHAVGLENISWWPSDWVVSFKRSCVPPFPLNLVRMPRPPKRASVLCFHGVPLPSDAIAGFRGKHLNCHVKPCPWVAQLWEGKA